MEHPTADEDAAIDAAHEAYREALKEANELEAQPFRKQLGDGLEATLDTLIDLETGVLADLIAGIKIDLEDSADVEPAHLLQRP